MGTTVFPFDRMRPFVENPDFEVTTQRLKGGGTTRAAEFGANYLYVCRFQVRLPGNSEDVGTWWQFLEDHQAGTPDTFLFKAHSEWLKAVTAETPAGTVGGGNTDFTLAKKHIDTSTLVVRRDGVPTAAYTLLTNNTTPTIRYDVAPTSSVGADYEYYQEVIFAGIPPRPVDRNLLSTDATSQYIVPNVEVEGDGPGSHLA